MPTKKILLIHYTAILILTLSFGLFLNHQKGQNFNQENLEKLVRGGFQKDMLTRDLCKYKMIGDPKQAGQRYIKFDIYCKNGTSVKSTLAADAIQDQTLLGVITEYSKIVGIVPGLITPDKCLFNNQKVSGQSQLTFPANILCTE